MPGRSSARSSAAPRLSKKASNEQSWKITTSPVTAPPEESAPSALRTQVCNIFSGAQHSTTGHRKLVTSLRKLQETATHESPETQTKHSELHQDEQNDFNTEFTNCTMRLLGVKKSEPVGDKTVRFIGLFLRHACEKG